MILLTPLDFWTSAETGARYPIRWRLAIPSQKLDLQITTPIERQELVLWPIIYWEGAIRIDGAHDGHRVSGHGYLELTGYAGGLRGFDGKM